MARQHLQRARRKTILVSPNFFSTSRQSFVKVAARCRIAVNSSPTCGRRKGEDAILLTYRRTTLDSRPRIGGETILHARVAHWVHRPAELFRSFQIWFVKVAASGAFALTSNQAEGRRIGEDAKPLSLAFLSTGFFASSNWWRDNTYNAQRAACSSSRRTFEDVSSFQNGIFYSVLERVPHTGELGEAGKGGGQQRCRSYEHRDERPPNR